jgi:hypothetical protein
MKKKDKMQMAMRMMMLKNDVFVLNLVLCGVELDYSYVLHLNYAILDEMWTFAIICFFIFS